MRTHIQVLAAVGLTVAALTGARAAERESAEVPLTRGKHRLVFLNGDKMHGALIGMEPGGGLRWWHPHAQETITFRLGTVGSVALAEQPPVTAVDGGLSRLELTNGDELLGQILAMDAGKVLLRTRYAGELTLKTAMVAAVFPEAERGARIYSGPTSRDEWTVNVPNNSKSKGRFQNQAFVMAGHGVTIGRDLKLPNTATISFDLSWRQRPQLHLYLYTDDIRRSDANGYSLRIENDEFSFYRHTRRRGSVFLGQIALPDFNGKYRAKLALSAEREKRIFVLRVDDKEVKRWTDEGDAPGNGRGLMFLSATLHEMRISNIRVFEGGGKVDPSFFAGKADTGDLIRFVNGDRVTGTFRGIRKDRIELASAYGRFNVPLERVLVVRMQESTRHLARKNETDVRAHFRSGGRVTMALDSLNTTEIAGHSECFGRATFQLDAFKLLEFNLYVPRDGEEEFGIW